MAAATLAIGLVAAACGSEDDPAGDGDGDGDGDASGGMTGDGDGDAAGGMTGDGDGDATGGMGGGTSFAPIDVIHEGSEDIADSLYGVAFTSDGLIYVSGERAVDLGMGGGPTEDMHTVVARYTAAGELDTDFGEGGVALLNAISAADDETDEAPGDEGTTSVVALPDGGAIVAIEANDGALGDQVVLARLDADGELVSGFGTAGFAVVPLSDYTAEEWQNDGEENGPRNRVYDIRLDTSGDEDRVIIFGAAPPAMSEDRTDDDRYVARVMVSDGSPDTDFADDGVFSIDFGELNGGDHARRGAVLEDGSIYSFGYTNYEGAGRHHIQILHLDADGVPVEDFGFQADATTCGAAQDGVICSNPNLADGGFAEAYSATLQSDGAIVTTGYGRADDADLPPDLVSFRFDATSMDTTYGTSGALIIDSGDEDRGRDIVALEDDRLVHVGKYDAVAAIYVTTPDGALWDDFGDGGVVSYSTHDGNFRGLATQDGVIAAVADGGSTGSSYLVILEVGE